MGIKSGNPIAESIHEYVQLYLVQTKELSLCHKLKLAYPYIFAT